MLRKRLFLVLFLLPVLLLAIACGEGASRQAFLDDAGATTPPPAPTEPLPAIDEKPKIVNPDEASAPEVDAISPKSATVGSVGPSIIVTGNNFVPRSLVQLDGAPLATSFVSGTELRATIPSNTLVTVGTMRVSVGTAPPGGGASKEVTFAVENPVPQLTQMTPLSVLAGANATQIELAGASFVQGAKILFGATDLTTTFTSGAELKATIPASLLATSGSVPITVVNPAPGGGTSSPISFTISNPSASIQSINPSAAFVASAPFEMTVNGAGFVSGSVVLLNGATLATTYQSSTTLKAQVTAGGLTAAGDFPVAVKNPPPGGGVSAPIVFKVQYPAPSATSLSPSATAAGTGPTEVTVTGVGFFITSQITFDSAPAATTFVDATHVKATLTAAQVASARSIGVRVITPAPGGGTSASLAFTVTNSLPSVTSLGPSSVVMGSPDTAVTMYGSGFVAGSTITSNGQVVTSSYVNGGQIVATVPANHLLNAGSVALVVINPAPGGGASQTAYLTVGCDTTGVNFALGPIGTTTSLATNLASPVALMSRWGNADSCTTAPLDVSKQQPGRYTVVQNTAGVPVTLSAWADCTNDGKGDAFLTFYRRPTIPANDTERLSCAFWVAEGTNAPGGYASPQHGGSAYCPGLTKANGGGLTLGVCEKAVVHIQAFDYASTTFTPPPVLRIRPD